MIRVPSQSYGASPATWDHTVLPATRHKWTRPALTPASKLVLDLPSPEGWKAELATWQCTSRELNPRSQVRRPKHYTTEPPKAKVNAKLYIETLVPRIIEEYKSLLPSGFIFQQEGAPTRTAVDSRLDCHQLQSVQLNSPDVNPRWLSRLGSYAWTLRNISSLRKPRRDIGKFFSIMSGSDIIVSDLEIYLEVRDNYVRPDVPSGLPYIPSQTTPTEWRKSCS